MKKRKLTKALIKPLCLGFLFSCMVADIQAVSVDLNTSTLSKLEEQTLPSLDSQQKNQKIKGVIKDEKGEPIIGANVIVKGSTIGVITGFDGDFSLDVPSGSTLVISYIGYISREIYPI